MSETQTDVQIRHQKARSTHDARQRADGLRHAAQVLEQNPPRGTIQCETVQKIIARLLDDAAHIDANIAAQ